MTSSEKIRNFAIISHIDHGKSTLADRFLEITNTVEKRDMKAQILDQMDLERERGITIKLQPVRMLWHATRINADGKENADQRGENPRQSAQVEYVLNLIDTPGHVDFSYEVSRSLAAVEGAILLVDATQGIQAQTLANLYQAQDQGLIIIPVVNKIDLPNANVEDTKLELADLLNIDPDEIIAVSAKTGENVEKILNRVIEKAPPPKGNIDSPTQALVFDSVYDNYRGVVAYIRVVNGEIKKNDRIKLLAANVIDQALETGVFTPKYKAKDSLIAGEIGYIVTGLKQVEECKVGDTMTVVNSKLQIPPSSRNSSNFTTGQANNKQISNSNDPNLKLKYNLTIQQFNNVLPLVGYKKVIPMVFASVYSADGEVNKLRDALGKLKLNDASFSYEPESSSAFGFGFKCGFLGLLHMEIVKERLEREYGLDLIVTSPKVNYLRLPRDEHQRILRGGSASESHDPRQSASYREPWVKVEVVSPQEYIGQIMDLFDKNRGVYQEMKFIGSRVLLEYQAPLAQIIVGFYDNLKSVSSGYASMNYEFIQYRQEDLVKMDILIAGEVVDQLAQVVHKQELNHKAQAITKKLKELIPRQWFEVSIQAAVGARILARENVPAMKKDVTGYLYGGDISRKKKLWAKQARGKKKMKKLGKVDIPTDVFINLLKQ